MASTTRPTTNRVLKQFEHDGIVALARGRTVVGDRAGLERPEERRTLAPRGRGSEWFRAVRSRPSNSARARHPTSAEPVTMAAVGPALAERTRQQ